MKYFLEFFLGSIVDYPEAVEVQAVDEGRRTVFYIHAHPEDVGKIIGRHGRTIQALRNVIASAAAEGQSTYVEVLVDEAQEEEITE